MSSLSAADVERARKWLLGYERSRNQAFDPNYKPNEVIEALAEYASTERQWIACEERFPNEIGDYLIFEENIIDGTRFIHWGVETWGVAAWAKNITHWQPLPAPPERSRSDADSNVTNSKTAAEDGK